MGRLDRKLVSHVIKLQLKLRENLSEHETAGVVARAAQLANGTVQRVFPDKADLASYYTIEAADTRAAQRAIRELKNDKDVEVISRPATRVLKSQK